MHLEYRKFNTFRKKLNIRAGNGYFSQKIKEYQKSKVKITNEIADNFTDFTPEDIITRSNELVKSVISKFNEWKEEYEN